MALPFSHLVSARVFYEQNFMAASVINYVTWSILGHPYFGQPYSQPCRRMRIKFAFRERGI
jgi:hypothetical protein